MIIFDKKLIIMITINLINDCTYIIIPLNFLMMFNYFLLNFFFYENLLKNKKKVQKVSSSVHQYIYTWI